MTLTFKDLNVGDKLWYVPANRRHSFPNGCSVEVTKIGRKYIYIENMKSQQWEHDGYAIAQVVEWPYGTFYKSKDDYISLKKWSTFQRDIRLLKLSQEQKKLILEIVGDLPQ